jgi:hypothetical protein
MTLLEVFSAGGGDASAFLPFSGAEPVLLQRVGTSQRSAAAPWVVGLPGQPRNKSEVRITREASNRRDSKKAISYQFH